MNNDPTQKNSQTALMERDDRTQLTIPSRTGEAAVAAVVSIPRQRTEIVIDNSGVVLTPDEVAAARDRNS